MPLFLLTLELTRPLEAYTALKKVLSGLAAVQVLEHGWMFRSPRSAVDLMQELRNCTHASDRILVAQISDAFAWSNPMGDPEGV